MSNQFTNLEELARLNNVDKQHHGYLPLYANLFEHIRFENIVILEIGYDRGRGARLLGEYFHRSLIYCLEIYKEQSQPYYDMIPADIRGRISLWQCDQGNTTELVETLRLIEKTKHYKPFSVVFDDGSHNPDHQISSFETVWPNVSAGGYYVIEDMHPSYVDGKHRTVEYFKDKLDKLNNFGDCQRKHDSPASQMPPSEYEWIMFTTNRIIVRKRLQ